MASGARLLVVVESGEVIDIPGRELTDSRQSLSAPVKSRDVLLAGNPASGDVVCEPDKSLPVLSLQPAL